MAGTGFMDVGMGMTPGTKKAIGTRTRDTRIRVPGGVFCTRVEHYLGVPCSNVPTSLKGFIQNVGCLDADWASDSSDQKSISGYQPCRLELYIKSRQLPTTMIHLARQLPTFRFRKDLTNLAIGCRKCRGRL
jgi:hypothetical protein